MKEENKYYVPDLEEFHVGFEFEIVPSKGLMIVDYGKPEEKSQTVWATEFEKMIYGDSRYDINIMGTGLPEINAGIKGKKVRARYLNREDIKAEGFRFISEDSFEKDNYTLKFNPNEYGRWVKIKDHEVEYDHFSGNIRNRSELKRVLNQIGAI